MTHYIVGLLRRGARPRTGAEAELDRLQERHLAHLRHLRETGELIATGPFEEETDLRGLLLFRTGSVAHARSTMAHDPLVEAGYLLLDLFTWFAPEGLAVSPRSDRPTDLTFDSD
jgi:uncharacterized protein YciI